MFEKICFRNTAPRKDDQIDWEKRMAKSKLPS